MHTLTWLASPPPYNKRRQQPHGWWHHANNTTACKPFPGLQHCPGARARSQQALHAASKQARKCVCACLELTRARAVAGPIYVCDAAPGDVLQVDILDLQPRSAPV